MKKIISISLVLALVAGAAFAVDLGGTVFGHANLIEGSTAEDSDVTGSGGMDRIRIDGAGEAGDGAFGGYLRLQGEDGTFDNAALAWWKPIDQFKLTIGKNGDGIWGKEGVTGWMFNQNPYDSSIAMGTGNIWGWGETVSGLQTRFAFFSGYDDNRVALEIKPMDMLAINIAIPYLAKAGEELSDIFKATVAQLDVNLDFGNIAITYKGDGPFGSGVVFAYFGGTFGDLGLDVGISYHLDTWDSGDGAFFAGLGVKYATDSFGVKFRTTVQVPIADSQELGMLFDLLPYFTISDSMSAFINMGVGISGADSDLGWFVNPYLRVGAEWGPTFYAGVKIGTAGVGSDDINFSVPISIMVSF